MPDDQNTISAENKNIQENPIPEENPIPTTPPAIAESSGEAQQEPTGPALENTTDLGDSHPSVPVEELGADGGDLNGVEYDNIPPPNDSAPLEPEKTQENQGENEPASESQLEAELKPPETVPEPETPQIPVNEPFEETQDKPLSESESEPSVSEAKEEPKPIETPEPEPEKEKPKISYLKSQKWGELLVMARNAMQFRKRKKLDRILTLFAKQTMITNDEVEKLLHISDATASRYLSQLEKEGKIKQHGRTGAGVSYSKI